MPYIGNKVISMDLLCVEHPNYREWSGNTVIWKAWTWRHWRKESTSGSCYSGREWLRENLPAYRSHWRVCDQVRSLWVDLYVTRNRAKLSKRVLSLDDFNQLWRVLPHGHPNTPNGDQSVVYKEFIEQLSRSPEDWCEAGLPWKGDHPSLPSNKSGSLKRPTTEENTKVWRLWCNYPRTAKRGRKEL